MTYLPPSPGAISANNSTSSTLGAGATFTGPADDVTQYASISVSYNANVAGAMDGLEMQFSTDGVNWDRKIKVTPEANNLQTAFGGVHMLSNIAKFFRVVYTNGDAAQGDFRLQTVYHEDRSLPLVSRSDQVINKHNDVALVRQVGEFNLDKARGLFGYLSNDTLLGAKDDVTNVEVTMWRKAGATSYVFPTTAETIRIAAGGDPADDAGTSGIGAWSVEVYVLDDNWAPQVITLTTAGAAASAASGITVRRINGARVINSGSYGGKNVSQIVIENTGSGQELSILAAGTGLADQAIFTVPAGFTCYITRYTINVGDSNKSTLRAYVREGADIVAAPFRAPVLASQFYELKGIGTVIPQTLRAFPEKSDFWITAQKVTGGSDSLCSAIVDYDLVANAS